MVETQGYSSEEQDRMCYTVVQRQKAINLCQNISGRYKIQDTVHGQNSGNCFNSNKQASITQGEGEDLQGLCGMCAASIGVCK